MAFLLYFVIDRRIFGRRNYQLVLGKRINSKNEIRPEREENASRAERIRQEMDRVTWHEAKKYSIGQTNNSSLPTLGLALAIQLMNYQLP